MKLILVIAAIVACWTSSAIAKEDATDANRLDIYYSKKVQKYVVFEDRQEGGFSFSFDTTITPKGESTDLMRKYESIPVNNPTGKSKILAEAKAELQLEELPIDPQSSIALQHVKNSATIDLLYKGEVIDEIPTPSRTPVQLLQIRKAKDGYWAVLFTESIRWHAIGEDDTPETDFLQVRQRLIWTQGKKKTVPKSNLKACKTQEASDLVAEAEKEGNIFFGYPLIARALKQDPDCIRAKINQGLFALQVFTLNIKSYQVPDYLYQTGLDPAYPANAVEILEKIPASAQAILKERMSAMATCRDGLDFNYPIGTNKLDHWRQEDVLLKRLCKKLSL